PIAEIARNAMHPERIVGMHFFSPVHRMPLVEVVRPEQADPRALARVVAEAQAMGKTAIVVRDTPGFYTTRVLGFMLAEAMAMLEEGARIEDIDRAMVAYGWPIGPLALTDEVGLVVARHVGETVAAARGIAAGPSAVQRLTDAGMQGKRNGRGFYRYEGKKRTPNADVYALIGMTPGAQWHGAESARRLTLLFTNEAARCLDEGVLRSPAEGDLGAVMGVGFPPFLGGPFRWADTEGAVLRDDLKRLAEHHGARRARPGRTLVPEGVRRQRAAVHRHRVRDRDACARVREHDDPERHRVHRAGGDDLPRRRRRAEGPLPPGAGTRRDQRRGRDDGARGRLGRRQP